MKTNIQYKQILKQILKQIIKIKIVTNNYYKHRTNTIIEVITKIEHHITPTTKN